MERVLPSMLTSHVIFHVRAQAGDNLLSEGPTPLQFSSQRATSEIRTLGWRSRIVDQWYSPLFPLLRLFLIIHNAQEIQGLCFSYPPKGQVACRILHGVTAFDHGRARWFTQSPCPLTYLRTMDGHKFLRFAASGFQKQENIYPIIIEEWVHHLYFPTPVRPSLLLEASHLSQTSTPTWE